MLDFVAARHAQTVPRNHLNDVPAKSIHTTHPRTAQPHGALDNYVEHRLHIRGRTGDNLQNVGRRCLPLQRLLCLVEEPHILDGDHRLVGEGLEQLDVMIGECSGLRPRDTNDADGSSLTHQGREQ